MNPNQCFDEMTLKNSEWKRRVEDVRRYRSLLTSANKLARRATAFKAFHKKYYRVFFDKISTNASGNYRGIVISAHWRKHFESLGEFGAALRLAGIPLEAANLEWSDLSTNAVTANSAVALSRWAYDSTLLSAPRGLLGFGHIAEAIADALDRHEMAEDLRFINMHLDGNIQGFREIIESVMSIENARDALTWNRSVVNPANWRNVSDVGAVVKEGLLRRTEALGEEAKVLMRELRCGCDCVCIANAKPKNEPAIVAVYETQLAW